MNQSPNKKSDHLLQSIVSVMRKSCNKEKAQRRQDNRYRDGRAYIDGVTELYSHAIYTRNIVADAAELSEEQKKVRDALCQLSETQQRRIYLYYYQGYTKQEIADMEGVSNQNISKSIKQALRKLKYILK